MHEQFPLPYHCDYDVRLHNKDCCIHSAWQKDTVEKWNEYCSHCEYGNKDVGIFSVIAGKKKQYLFTNGLSEKKEYLIYCKQQEDAEYAMSLINPQAEAICFSWGYIENFSFLEKFSKLKYLRLDSSKATHLSWDITKNPNLEHLSIEGKRLFDISGLEKAYNLHSFMFTIATSRTDKQDIKSLEPISKLPNLESVEVQGARLEEANIDHLISIPKLQHVFVSPDTYSMEDFAKFEAKKFVMNETYGCYFTDEEYFWRYGYDTKPLRIKLEKKDKIQAYIKEYERLMDKYR